jgi:hypothetical protein
VTLVSLISSPKQRIFYTVLLSVFELQKSSSPGLKPRTDFQGCGLCFFNLSETNYFGLGAILVMHSIQATETTFVGNQTQQFVGVVTSVLVIFYLK